MRMRLYTTLIVLLLTAGLAQAQVVTTIYDIQQDLIVDGTLCQVEDLVVTAIDDIPTGFGFWAMEQAGGAHSGIYVFLGTIAPPTVIIGDVVDVIGVYDDYYGLAELNLSPDHGGSGSVTVVGVGAVPEPELLRAWQTKTANPLEAEKWESVLVQLENLTALDLDPGYGEWFAEEFGFAVNDTTRCDDGAGVSGPPAGTQMSSITGILHFSYDDFKIEPRAEYDIVYVGAAPAPNVDYAVATGDASVDVYFDREVEITSAENPFNYFFDLGITSTATLDATDAQLVHLALAAPMAPEVLLTLTVFDVQNTDGVPMVPQATQFWGGINTIPFAQTPDAGADSSAYAGQIMTIRGVVHSKYDVWGSHVYLQTEIPEGPRSGYDGIEVYLPSYVDTLDVGDVLVIGDEVGEYYNMTSLTQPFYYFEKVGSGAAVSEAEVVSIVDPTDVLFWEEHEGCLVKVENVAVVERGGDWNFYEWAVTQDDLNWLHIGDMGDYAYVEGLYDTLNITGVLRFEFGEYKLHPRSDADIEILYQNPNNAGDLPAGAKIALSQNHPNPFNPRTKISFQLAEPGVAKVEVFNAQGRLVKSLHSGQLDAGPHDVIWQGDTDDGDQAVTGLYFYKLSANGASETKKMLLLK